MKGFMKKKIYYDMVDKEELYFKFTGQDSENIGLKIIDGNFKSLSGNCKWNKNWKTIPKNKRLITCCSGFHCSQTVYQILDVYAFADMGDVYHYFVKSSRPFKLCVVEFKGEKNICFSKSVHRSMRIICYANLYADGSVGRWRKMR